MPPQRLQKILAQAGVASRRQAEQMILAGRVAVDGVVVKALGSQADPQRQVITVDNQPLPRAQGLEYWLAHKPRGVVCTSRDPQGRTRVADLLPPEIKARLYPVGRLDIDSEGLVLLTNDGELALRLTHPRYQVPKSYRVWVKGLPSRGAITRLRQGVPLEDGPSLPARVFLKSGGQRTSKLSIVINEGRKREIRRMCEQVGHPVTRLVRVGLGPLRLGDMPPGACRRLSPGEIKGLRQAAGLFSACKTGSHGVPNRPRTKAKPPKRRS